MAVQVCKECSTLMTPKVEDGYLVYVCDKCDTRADPISPILYTETFTKPHGSYSHKKEDLIHDVTLPRLNLKCHKCLNKECICYMENSEERALNCFYVCTKCLYEWTD